MSLNKNMIHFSQFVVINFWYVQMWCKSKIIGCDFGKGFDFGVSFYGFDMWSDDLLFLYGGRFFLDNVDDSVIRSL